MYEEKRKNVKGKSFVDLVLMGTILAIVALVFVGIML